MKESRRALRMIRHHSRKKTASLNMVSLMDIFTILVFFLLVSASDQESMPSMKDIKLPEAYSEQKPKGNLVVLVSGKTIMLSGKVVADARVAIRSRSAIIPGLAPQRNFESLAGPTRKKLKSAALLLWAIKRSPMYY
mgnify:CR=1 FL=1